jgi:16S rRNA (guanine966-N2)-methyltransferase
MVFKTSYYPGQLRIIGGQWRRRSIAVLEQPGLRPTPDRVRETLFNWLAPDIEQAICLDLFAGSGILGFEALSRGAAHVTMLDNNPSVVAHLKKIAQNFTIAPQHLAIYCQSASHWLKALPAQGYDIIFIDPPFASDLLVKILTQLIHYPGIGPNTLLYVETAAQTPLPLTQLPWQPIRSKIASQVSYYLLAQEM